MRAFLFASATLLIAGGSLVGSNTQSSAREFPWCARSTLTSGNPECSYASYSQCQARVSGLGGDCIQNPYLAYGQYRGGRSDRVRDDNWQNGSWDRR